jgi:hypothetical protein
MGNRALTSIEWGLWMRAIGLGHCKVLGRCLAHEINPAGWEAF